MTPMLSQDNALVQFLGGEFLNRRISNKGGGLIMETQHNTFIPVNYLLTAFEPGKQSIPNLCMII